MSGRPVKDLSGQRFGKLVAVKAMSEREASTGAVVWLAKCDCGEEVRRVSYRLRPGNRSCGCSSGFRPRASTWRPPEGFLPLPGGRANAYADYAGKRMGKLVAVRRLEKQDGKGYWIWSCRCDCGAEAERSVRGLGVALSSESESSCEDCKPKNPARLVVWAKDGVCSWCSRETQRLVSECDACNRQASRAGRAADGRPIRKTRAQRTIDKVEAVLAAKPTPKRPPARTSFRMHGKGLAAFEARMGRGRSCSWCGERACACVEALA